MVRTCCPSEPANESSRPQSRSGAVSQTREQLSNRARQLQIEGRSGMSKEELQRAIDHAEIQRLQTMSLSDLRDCAHAFDIEGRSKMSREELIRAIGEVRRT